MAVDLAQLSVAELARFARECDDALRRRPVDELLAARAEVARAIELAKAEELLLATALELQASRRHEPPPESPAGDAAVPQRAPERGSDSSTSSEAAKPEPPPDDELPASEETPPIIEREPEQEPEITPDIAAPAPARARTVAVAREGQRDRDAKVLAVVLKVNRPVAKRDVVATVDLTVTQVEASLKRLVEAGRIAATGEKSLRRYSPAEHEWHSKKRAEVEEGTARNNRKIDDAVGRVGLRDRVMKAIAADPAALDNQRLALALDADLQDIADACEYLVGNGRVQMADDGTYLRSVAEAAREVAAA